MVQMENVKGEAEQQPFSSNLHIAPKQKTPEIKLLLHIRKVVLSLNGTVHPKQISLGRGELCFHSLRVYPEFKGGEAGLLAAFTLDVWIRRCYSGMRSAK